MVLHRRFWWNIKVCILNNYIHGAIGWWNVKPEFVWVLPDEAVNIATFISLY